MGISVCNMYIGSSVGSSIGISIGSSVIVL